MTQATVGTGPPPSPSALGCPCPGTIDLSGAGLHLWCAQQARGAAQQARGAASALHTGESGFTPSGGSKASQAGVLVGSPSQPQSHRRKSCPPLPNPGHPLLGHILTSFFLGGIAQNWEPPGLTLGSRSQSCSAQITLSCVSGPVGSCTAPGGGHSLSPHSPVWPDPC